MFRQQTFKRVYFIYFIHVYSGKQLQYQGYEWH